jgi:effector-binding domain-containing protein
MPTMKPSLEVREVAVPPALALELEMSVGTSSADVSAAMGQAFDTLMGVVGSNSLTVAGPPRTIYPSWNPASTHCIAVIPIMNPPDRSLNYADVKIVSSPERQALRFTHHGSYASARDTYVQIDTWLRERGAIETEADWSRYSPMWEEYVGDPTTTPEQELMTYIYLPLK